jgi:hypothetical protein
MLAFSYGILFTEIGNRPKIKKRSVEIMKKIIKKIIKKVLSRKKRLQPEKYNTRLHGLFL